MIVKITSKRQVTLPTHALDAMGVGPGDTHELIESPDGYCCAQDVSTPRAWAACGTRFRTATRRLASAHSERSPMTQLYGIDTSVPTGGAKSALIPGNPSAQNPRRGL